MKENSEQINSLIQKIKKSFNDYLIIQKEFTFTSNKNTDYVLINAIAKKPGNFSITYYYTVENYPDVQMMHEIPISIGERNSIRTYTQSDNPNFSPMANVGDCILIPLVLSSSSMDGKRRSCYNYTFSTETHLSKIGKGSIPHITEKPLPCKIKNEVLKCLDRYSLTVFQIEYLYVSLSAEKTGQYIIKMRCRYGESLQKRKYKVIITQKNKQITIMPGSEYFGEKGCKQSCERLFAQCSIYPFDHIIARKNDILKLDYYGAGPAPLFHRNDLLPIITIVKY